MASVDKEVPPALDPDEVPVERVEHMGDALKRLAQGAGKDAWDVVCIEEERGLASDGTVTTELRYPFGFETKLRASSLKTMLAHLQQPKVSVAKTMVTFTESGRRSKLPILMRDVLVADYPMPVNDEDLTAIEGSWLTRLLPIMPTRSGHHMFAGAYVGPEGYVATDTVIMVWTQAAGLDPGGVIPKQLVERIPSGPLKLYLDDNRCWARDDNTTWSGPLLEGTFPNWQGVYSQIDVDRHVVLLRTELLSAMQYICSVNRNCYVQFKDDKVRIVSDRVSDQQAYGMSGSSAVSTLDVESSEGDEFVVLINGQSLLSQLQRSLGTTVTLHTNERMDLIRVVPEMHPSMDIIQLCLAGSGAIPE